MMIQPAAQPAPDDRATEFKAVDSNANEQFSGYNLMVEAYFAIWIILMIWLVMLWRKQASLAARVVGLEEAINRAEKKLQTKAAAKAPKAAEEPEPAKKTAEEAS